MSLGAAVAGKWVTALATRTASTAAKLVVQTIVRITTHATASDLTGWAGSRPASAAPLSAGGRHAAAGPGGGHDVPRVRGSRANARRHDGETHRQAPLERH